jgi:hypothetical protein
MEMIEEDLSLDSGAEMKISIEEPISYNESKEEQKQTREKTETSLNYNKIFDYFENTKLTEVNSLSNAIETASITTSVKKALLLVPIISYVNSLETKAKPSATELKTLLREIEEIQRNQSLELAEYSRVIVAPSSPREEEISEYRQEYGAAVEQICSQMKASDERRLEAALRTMNSLEADEVKGGYARLLSLIETRVKSSDDAVELLKARLSQSREEFISLRHSDALLEKTAQISYEKVRDAYTHLLRLSHRRSNENDLQWIGLEARGREWMMSEMKAVLRGYRSHGSSDLEQSDRVNQHRLAASRRLQRFGDRLIANSLKITERAEMTSETALRAKKLQAFAWRKKQAGLMNDWLETTEQEIEKRYQSSLQELSEKISSIRTQLQFLDLHSKKLSHLHHLSQKSYDNIRSKSVIVRRASLRSSVPGKMARGADSRRDSLDDTSTPPPVSMNLGTRLLGLSKSVGVESEECLLLLTQLFHTLSPDPLLLQRLSHQVAHYEALLAKRKS